ncbi:HAD family hydrolase [Spongisporangium articulatum]|uniref:HAD family hydrolase n=1 Tax=Spongisporangium articulatum TaxID=3362603 RepID=A0ABW8AID7_9ACTN
MRMVACDLDGTIVRADGTVSRRTKEALTACEKQGVEVVFVTGRPPRWVAPIASLTGNRGVALCGNGAAVLDLSTGVVTESHPLSIIDLLDAVARLRVRLPGAVFAIETMTGYRREPAFLPGHAEGAGEEIQVGALADLLIDMPPVLKVLVKLAAPYDRMRADDMLAAARAAVAGLAEAVHSNPDGGMLELSAVGVTKSAALSRLARKLGVSPRDVVAFGDMPNDVDMLEWAGDGYAMEGGHRDAIRAAGQTAPPCEEDGVAQVLERLLFPAKAKAKAKKAPATRPVGPPPAQRLDLSDAAPTAAGPVTVLRPDQTFSR